MLALTGTLLLYWKSSNGDGASMTAWCSLCTLQLRQSQVELPVSTTYQQALRKSLARTLSSLCHAPLRSSGRQQAARMGRHRKL